MTQPGATTGTFLFSDIEGSTKMIQALAADYPRLLAEHRDLISGPVEAHGGRVFGTEGDALFCVFPSPVAAVEASLEAQRGLAAHAWPAGGEIRVRMGIHTGEAIATGEDFVGLTLHEVARLMSAGHGGQVLVSNITRQLIGQGLPAGVTLRDLGEHRLKDLSMPERLFQVVAEGLRADFPPLRTLSARPNNLPVQVTSFVGRAELDEARKALGGTRLLTLSGPGGTGKTRLALQLAAEMSDEFPDGVFFVNLDSIRDPALVPTQIGQALGLTSSAAEPPAQQVLSFLRDKKVLLVLDNFEQIVDAGPYVGQLLRELAQVKLIVTSRILLRVYGETDYPVPPLGLPALSDRGPWTAEQAAHFEAVRLFVERALAALPSFALTDANATAIVEIVRRLDGLPLAIELAAARVRIFSVEQIAARVDQRLRLLTGGARDLPERQQTLRGAIDWSYDLLETADRKLFDRFSVFEGGAFLTQAEPVCGSVNELGTDVFDGLASLAEKSLVRGAPTAEDDPRFVMLATIREYAQEKLSQDADGVDLHRRHAMTYVQLTESAEGHLTGADAARWLDRLEIDHDNIRAALDWAVEMGEAETAFRLIAAVWRFWQVRGHIYEARRIVDRVLTMPEGAQLPAKLRTRALAAGGGVTYWQADFPQTYRYYTAALEAARESGDQLAVARALYDLSFAPIPEPPQNRIDILAGSVPLLEEAAELFEELHDAPGISDTNWALGFALIAVNRLEDAEKHAQRAYDQALELNDPFRIGWNGHIIGSQIAHRGDIARAEPIFRRSLDIFRASGDQGGLILLLLDYALLAELRGDMSRYWRLSGAINNIRQKSGIGTSDISFFDVGVEFFWHLPTIPTSGPELADFEAGKRLTMEEAIELALAEPAEPAAAEAAG
jgi:predicted ATPase/class 3 adenylate cyclase